LGDPLVFAEEAAKDGPASDLLLGQVGHGVVGRGRAESAAAVGPSSVVVPGVLCENRPQVPFAEDQHPVGHLGPGGEDEPFGVGVRARAAGRNLHRLDAGGGQGRVEGRAELAGAVADQEPQARGPVTKACEQVADLLGGPRAVRVRGDSQDVQVTGADPRDEQAVQAPERYRAVHREEVRG
jgi:hypothetical protein